MAFRSCTPLQHAPIIQWAGHVLRSTEPGFHGWKAALRYVERHVRRPPGSRAEAHHAFFGQHVHSGPQVQLSPHSHLHEQAACVWVLGVRGLLKFAEESTKPHLSAQAGQVAVAAFLLGQQVHSGPQVQLSPHSQLHGVNSVCGCRDERLA